MITGITETGRGHMHYHFKVHREGDGFWAECIELPGCVTEGDSSEELFENMQEALNTYLEEPSDSVFVAPLPKTTLSPSRSVVKVPVDPETLSVAQCCQLK